MSRKNVIVIMSDEHNPNVLGCSGHPIIHTPHLDALAENGIRFTNAYTPCPICVPSRAAFATGKRVHHVRHWDNAMPYAGQEKGWGHILQQHGIKTASIGKLHYRDKEDPVGFDEEIIPMHVVGGYGMVWGSIRDPYLKKGNDERMLGDYIGAGDSHYTEYDKNITEKTKAWLRNAALSNESFVLYVGLVAPHFPLIVPQEFFDLYPADILPPAKLLPQDGYHRHPWVQNYADFDSTESKFKSEEERLKAFSAYYGLCSYLDNNIGDILSVLNETGLNNNTTVIYTSDHGDNLGARGLWGKSTLYQESVGIPMIISGPNIAPGVCHTPVDLLDLFPTILSLAGCEYESEMSERPGVSILDIAQQPKNDERVIFSEYHAAGSNTAAYMIRKGDWKYHYYVRHEAELFNLVSDPEETKNLINDPAYAAIREDLHAELLRICHPEETDQRAKIDQADLIARIGGLEKARLLGPKGATPAPKKAQI
ncbi:sulfatase-like hydrolase/transferase [Pectobacterium fontis]|uniref:Sulfatase n=1 Tax=Pectobacterium fontis TaxID=2558042 RepID=A0A7V8IIX8_9GAMM|nr:sulfatase-like hydrolase/transferase [Pectobacterium fontis]KHN51911.1 sulfatase [Pectobacterium fontis]